MNGYIDGWIDGWMNEWMDGWILESGCAWSSCYC